MNLILKNALTGFVVLIGLGPVSAFAQDAACSCTTAYQGAAGAIGSVSRVSGDALISQAAGFDLAKPGSSLGFGSRVVVGPKGLANGIVEVKRRATDERVELAPADAVARVAS